MTRRGFHAARPVQLLDVGTNNGIPLLGDGFLGGTLFIKRWEDGRMVLRWVGAAVTEASKGFRRLRGHKGMLKLIAALRAHDAALGITLETAERAA